MSTVKDYYQANIDFWETAWSRVKKASTKIPDTIEYIPEIPGAFKDHGCKHILDLACGSGWLSFYMQEHGLKVTGVDISPSAIKLARDLQDERGTKNIDFQVADMMNLDFPADSFDGILINACFEHLDYQRGDEFLAKMKNLVRVDGIMFGVFDKVASGERGTYEELEDGSYSYTDEFRRGMLLRYYPDDELYALLAKHHWQPEFIKKNNYESRIVVARNVK